MIQGISIEELLGKSTDNKQVLLKKHVTYDYLVEKFKEYMSIYGEDFPDNIREYMQMTAIYLEGLNTTETACYNYQFYDEYNMMHSSRNYYHRFVDLINKKYKDLSNKTIIDVGGGVVPSLGRRLAKLAKHVIVIDRDITAKNNPTNLEVIKRDITSIDDIPDADLIVGFMPCEATDYIVDYACHNDVDFMLELCGCIHDPSFRYPGLMKWLAYQKQKAREIGEKVASSNLGICRVFDSRKKFPNILIDNVRR